MAVVLEVARVYQGEPEDLERLVRVRVRFDEEVQEPREPRRQRRRQERVPAAATRRAATGGTTRDWARGRRRAGGRRSYLSTAEAVEAPLCLLKCTTPLRPASLSSPSPTLGPRPPRPETSPLRTLTPEAGPGRAGRGDETGVCRPRPPLRRSRRCRH